MRRPLPTLLAFALILSACGSTRASGAATAPPSTNVVLVNPYAVSRTIPKDFFGINFVAFWDTAAGSQASARALAQTPIKVLRFPGGAPADWYDWQQPHYKGWSHTSPLQLWQFARSAGVKRVIFGTNYQGNLPNPPGKTYAVNSPENAAAWVAYDRSKGINAEMEVGNEEDMNLLHSADDSAYSAYISAFNQQARAMHAADPRVQVLGPVGTNEYYWWALDGLGMFLKSTGNRSGTGQADGVSLHFYKGASWLDSIDVPQYWLSPSGPWAAIEKMIQSNDTRRLPVSITEWNAGVSGNNNPFNATVGHALVTADMVGALALSGVKQEDYFAIHGANGWGLLYGPGESRPVDSPTPSYYAMALWKHMGSRLLSVKQSDDAKSVMSTYATRGPHGSLQVLAINKQPEARTVRMELQGASPSGHTLQAYTLVGADGGISALDAVYDGKKSPSPSRRLPGPARVGTVKGRVISYTVPGYSAVVLDLSGLSRSRSVRWKTPAPTAPPPAPRVATQGSVGQAAVKPGDSEHLTATVKSNADLGPGMVDLEVYDASGTKVYQQTQNVTIKAGKTLTVDRDYPVPNSAYGGTYIYKIGVFGSNWTPTYTWNDKAATFRVDAPPPPKITVTGQTSTTQVQPGSTITFTATVSAADNSLPNALVDFEVYDSGGSKVWQDTQAGVAIPKDGSVAVTKQWTVPSPASGTYTLKLGVFGPNWSPTYAWNDGAATLGSGAAGTAHVSAPSGLGHAVHNFIAGAYHAVRGVAHRLRGLLHH